MKSISTHLFSKLAASGLITAVFGLGLTGCAETLETDAPESRLTRSKEAAVTLPLGCSPSGQCQVDFAVSNGASLDQLGAVATESLRLANRAQVLGATTGYSSALSGTTGGVFVGGGARLFTALSASTAQVDSGAVLAGRVYAGGAVTVQPGAQIAGGVQQNQPFYTHQVNVVPPVNVPSTFAAGINLEPDRTRTVAAGAYAFFTVKSRATLTLGAGTYFVRNLSLEPQANLRLRNGSAPVEIHVLDQLMCKGNWLPALAAPNVRIVYWGTAASIVECNLSSTSLVAPNAFVRLADRKTAGQILAKSLELGADAVARAVPFQPFVTGPSSKLLKDLTANERSSSCQALAAQVTPEDREVHCRLQANSAIVLADPATNAAAQTICEDAYDECLNADPCAEPETYRAGCTATVGERNACLLGLVPAHADANAHVPSCAETSLYAAYTYSGHPLESLPAACGAYFACMRAAP